MILFYESVKAKIPFGIKPKENFFLKYLADKSSLCSARPPQEHVGDSLAPDSLHTLSYLVKLRSSFPINILDVFIRALIK